MKRGPYFWLSAILALAGVLMSSTVIAWATPCGDDCPSMQQAAHSCCQPADPPGNDPRISAQNCCGHELASACGSVAYFEPGDSAVAHTHSDAIASAAGRIQYIVALPRPVPVAATPPPGLAPVPLPATQTIVLLL